MAKKIIIVMALVLIGGCDRPAPTEGYTADGYRIRTFEHDGCEYVMVGNTHPSVTHKGNCRHCAERAKVK